MSSSPVAMDSPAWASDGRLIAFAGIRGGWDDSADYEIWTMRSDGSARRQLTHDVSNGGVARAIEPSWSPDGRRIVVLRQADRPRGELAVVSVSAGSERTLHVAGGDPAWGKPGIAYVGGRGIMLLDPDTGRSRHFASPHEPVAALAWSSDGELAALDGTFGQRIVTARRPPRDAYTGLWTVKRSGRHWRRLPFSPAVGASCVESWR